MSDGNLLAGIALLFIVAVALSFWPLYWLVYVFDRRNDDERR